MASTLTAFVPRPERFSYIGLPPGMLTETVPVPRAAINFRINAGVVTEAAAGEDQLFSIACLLAEGYGYILSEINLFFNDAEAGDGADWGSMLTAWVSNTDVTHDDRILSGIKFEGYTMVTSTTALSSSVFQVDLVPSQTIIPVQGTSGKLHVSGFNATIDGGPLTLWFLAKFLEFDLAQAHHWAVNTPYPVR